MELQRIIEEFQDFLAPMLDAYEEAIYLYIFRHSRLLELSEAILGFKSARLKIAFGRPKGQGRARMSENTCYEKLQSLEHKGCIKIVGTERGGTRVRLYLAHEIPGVIPPGRHEAVLDLEEMDFFTIAENRLLILQREQGKCFYCLRVLNQTNY